MKIKIFGSEDIAIVKSNAMQTSNNTILTKENKKLKLNIVERIRKRKRNNEMYL